MNSQETINAISAVNQENMMKDISVINENIKWIFDKLDNVYASKIELESISVKVNYLSELINKIMFGLLSSSIFIIISLVVFIYLTGIK